MLRVNETLTDEEIVLARRTAELFEKRAEERYSSADARALAIRKLLAFYNRHHKAK